MQPVDVLRHQREVADALLELHQSLMASVGQTTRQPLPPPVVPLPAQLGIPREGPRGSELFRPILSPQTIGSTEGGYPALRGDARPGQHAHPLRTRNPLGGSPEGFLIVLHRLSLFHRLGRGKKRNIKEGTAPFRMDEKRSHAPPSKDGMLFSESGRASAVGKSHQNWSWSDSSSSRSFCSCPSKLINRRVPSTTVSRCAGRVQIL